MHSLCIVIAPRTGDLLPGRSLRAGSTRLPQPGPSTSIKTVRPGGGRLRDAGDGAGKLLENTYRHINIALVKELAILAHELGIDIWEVIGLAATKPFARRIQDVGAVLSYWDPYVPMFEVDGLCMTRVDDPVAGAGGRPPGCPAHRPPPTRHPRCGGVRPGAARPAG